MENSKNKQESEKQFKKFILRVYAECNGVNKHPLATLTDRILSKYTLIKK
jgi:hypothetical protein